MKEIIFYTLIFVGLNLNAQVADLSVASLELLPMDNSISVGWLALNQDITETANQVENTETGTCPSTVMDIEGNEYRTVLIGTQCWMAENLQVAKYRNGDEIPTGFDVSVKDYEKLVIGTAAPYLNSSANKQVYGMLYNWFAVRDGRGICPTGWHVPSDDEWKEMIKSLGGYGPAGVKMKTVGNLKDRSGLWAYPNKGATNESGFSGLPGGIRYGPGRDSFGDLGEFGLWWSSTPNTWQNLDAVRWHLDFEHKYAGSDLTRRRHSLSVRCVKD